MDAEVVETAKLLLKKRQLKATPTRMEVVALVKQYGSAMPYSKIQKQLEGTDRITLYRTLNALLDKGLIHKAYSTNDDTYYALCGDTCTAEAHTHNHVHFKCSSCEAVTCQHLEGDVAIVLPSYQIESVNIAVSGICPGCQ